MPRGRRKASKSIAEQISELDQQIAELTNKKNELLKQQEQEAIQQLLEAAKAAGKSPIELVQELTSKQD